MQKIIKLKPANNKIISKKKKIIKHSVSNKVIIKPRVKVELQKIIIGNTSVYISKNINKDLINQDIKDQCLLCKPCVRGFYINGKIKILSHIHHSYKK